MSDAKASRRRPEACGGRSPCATRQGHQGTASSGARDRPIIEGPANTTPGAGLAICASMTSVGRDPRSRLRRCAWTSAPALLLLSEVVGKLNAGTSVWDAEVPNERLLLVP